MLLSTGEGNNNNRFEIGLIRCELSFLPFFYSHLAHEQRSPFIILSLTIGKDEGPAIEHMHDDDVVCCS